MPRDRGIRWNLRVSELRDAYERYDGAAPQYRKNMWQNVSGYRIADTESGTICCSTSHTVLHLSSP